MFNAYSSRYTLNDIYIDARYRLSFASNLTRNTFNRNIISHIGFDYDNVSYNIVIETMYLPDPNAKRLNV